MQYMMEKANNIDSDQTAIMLFRSSLIFVHIVCLFFSVGSLISCLDGATLVQLVVTQIPNFDIRRAG